MEVVERCVKSAATGAKMAADASRDDDDDIDKDVDMIVIILS